MEERRRSKRYNIYCPLEYVCKDKSVGESSISLNISDCGALISAENLLKVGTPVVVKVFLRDKSFDIESEVVRVQKEENSQLYNLGVKFLVRSWDFVKRFYDEIEAILLYKEILSHAKGVPISLTEASIEWYSK